LRPHVLWPLVAVELTLFATVVHSITTRWRPRINGLGVVWLGMTSGGQLEDRSMEHQANQSQTTDSTSPDEMEETAPSDTYWEHVYGDYIVRCRHGEYDTEIGPEVGTILEIFRKGENLFFVSGGSFDDPGEERDPEEDSLPPPGSDLTGEGQPCLVVSEWSGGAHCCRTYYIFQLGDTFRIIDKIEAEHGDVSFEDLDENGIPVIRMEDWSYAYAFGCFASSPAPELILRYNNGHYEVAPDLMTTATVDDGDVQDIANDIKAQYKALAKQDDLTGEWAADVGLWQEMLDLIYGGQEEAALKLFNLAWPEDQDDKEQSLSNFVDVVSNSTFWQAMYGIEEVDGTNAVGAVETQSSER
jgi:hypothetical protein